MKAPRLLPKAIPWLALELLEIFGSGLTDEGKKQLKESTAFPKLQTLVVE